MKKNKSDRKRDQAPKGRNPEFAKAMQELRRSSAASPQANKARYSRKDRRDTSWKKDY